MSKKYQRGAISWAMYDWANSAWATTVLAGFFPVFFQNYWGGSLTAVQKHAYLGYANSAAAIVVFIVAPVLGAIADRGSAKKRMLMGFAGLGIIMTGSLYYIGQGQWLLAAAVYALSYVFWLAANISYDALIVGVSSDKDVDKVSGLGFSLGYIGGGVLFLVNVLMTQIPGSFGLIENSWATVAGQLDSEGAVRIEDLTNARDEWKSKVGNGASTSMDEDTEEAVYQLALLQHNAGDLEEAGRNYELAIASRTARLDPSGAHPDIAEIRVLYGRLLMQRGDITGAETEMRAALVAIENSDRELLGDTPELQEAEYYDALGDLYASGGELERAEESYESALTIRERFLTEMDGDVLKEDPELIAPLLVLARLDLRQQDFAEAEERFNRVERIRAEKEGADSPITSQTMIERAEFLEARGDISSAREELSDLVALRREAYDPTNPDVIHALNLLAAFELRHNNVSVAEPLAIEAYELHVEGKSTEEIAEEPGLLLTIANRLAVARANNNAALVTELEAGRAAITEAWILSVPGEASSRVVSRLSAAKGLAVRISFLSVAVWWIIFALPLIFRVPEPKGGDSVSLRQAIRDGFSQLSKTFHKIRKARVVFMFLLAYWFYIDGVDTIITMAVSYGASLGIGTGELISALLLVQFVAAPFAFLFGWLGQKFGPKRLILVGIGIYCFITIYAAAALDNTSIYVAGVGIPKFYLLALLVATAQGGVQALSRSLFSRLIPEDQSAEFFGFYNMIGKFAAIVGPAMMGAIGEAAGSTRAGIFSIIVLFIVGGTLLFFVNEKSGQKLADELEQD